MTYRSLPIVMLCFAALASPAHADQAKPVEPAKKAEPRASRPLDTLRPERPRVLARRADFERVRALVKADPLAKRWYAELRQRGEAMLDEPVTRYELRDGRRLLYESRETLDRVLTLSMLDWIERDDRYRDRIWQDLEAAAAFEDWNPDHFLDVAEMAFAFAIAYDWMYHAWTREQRDTIVNAIETLAIRPALEAYSENAWWTRTRINWNQVCNGGLITAALALADHKPGVANWMLERSLGALPRSMGRYAPDGGYDEGPGYWSYGTLYNVVAIAALQSATARDFGLSDAEGFNATGDFPLQMTGPTEMSFNFGDGGTRPTRSPAMFYLARRFEQPAWARYAAEHNRGSALDLLWYDPDLAKSEAKPRPLGVAFRSAGVAVMRSAWDDPDAWFVGVKGGWADHGHAQHDLGSFILERHGVRWLIDLGADDYNLPGYFASQHNGARWRYYRNRAEGHNTLVINPSKDQLMQQAHDARVPVTYDDFTIHADLSHAYRADAQRAITLDRDNDRVRVVDTLSFDAPAEVWWFAHTRARVALAEDGRSATLTRGGEALRVRLVAPADARFTLMDARPLPTSPDPEGQNPNDGSEKINPVTGAKHVKRGELPRFGDPDPEQAVRKLAIRLTDVKDTRVEVVFESAGR
ncbi:MAG: heparinase II/III family protein [Phycisphaeraceae bacterium]